MSTLTFDQWMAKQRASDPSWDRRVEQFARVHGPPRKVRFLVDENLGDGFARLVNTLPGYKGATAQSGASDKALWNLARRQEMPILTADHDFWNDRQYPLQQCPGAVILIGQSADEQLGALRHLEGQWGIVARYRTVRAFLQNMKITAHRSDFVAKFWDDGDVVRIE